MPADPKLNESRILEALANDELMLTPNGARSLFSLVLLACYDRKVERDFMADMIDKCAEAEQTVADLECAGRMYTVLYTIEPEGTPANLNEEVERLSRLWISRRKALAEKFSLVCQCPTTLDRVN